MTSSKRSVNFRISIIANNFKLYFDQLKRISVLHFKSGQIPVQLTSSININRIFHNLVEYLCFYTETYYN